ncbi:hypothetical protein EDE12_106176 [Methylosinus sp. sav-2]|nr:hypothetical protein EDE12_106176 [Methylosinus sp. sav-2]
MTRIPETPKMRLETLDHALAAITMAERMLAEYVPLFVRFAKESRAPAESGHILSPEFFTPAQRRASIAIVAPQFDAASRFVSEARHHRELATAAINKVSRAKSENAK